MVVSGAPMNVEGEAQVKAASGEDYDPAQCDPPAAPTVGDFVPIFMDRHDLRGLKADDVAEAHRRDVDIQDRHGVKYMAYWFDENNGAAFCLVHAPDPATAERVHREAHGEIPTPSFRSI
jgi:hypothetical protein